MLGIGRRRGTSSSTNGCVRALGSARREPLFPRIEKTVEELRQMADQAERQQSGTGAPNPEPGTQNPNPSTQNPEPGTAVADGRISIDAFMNVELRTAKVIAAEAVPEVEEADQAAGRSRNRAADDPRGHRRGLSAGVTGRPHHRHRGQPEAGQADGHRVQRDGARRESGGREAGARDRGRRTGMEGSVTPREP